MDDPETSCEKRTVRCEGGEVSAHQDKRPWNKGWWRACCPSCGRDIAFHWSTGRFRAHNRPGGES